MSSDNQNRAYILMGKSGAGKGTQAKLLQEYLESQSDKKVLYVETGQKFREFMEEDNLSARKVKAALDEGQLLPAFLPIWVWTQYLIDNFTGDEDVIFDGMARRLYEAQVLDNALQFYFDAKPVVIDVSVSNDWAKARLLARGRYDDNEDDINERLAFYDKDVVPALNFFKEDTKHFDFVTVNGEQSIEEVHDEIIKKVFGKDNGVD